MQGGEQEMTCLGGGHSHVDGLIIPHFTKKNHIRALTQSGPESRHVIFRIHVDLALAHNTACMAVQIFKRILEGDNMPVLVLVDLVDNTGQSG